MENNFARWYDLEIFEVNLWRDFLGEKFANFRFFCSGSRRFLAGLSYAISFVIEFKKTALLYIFGWSGKFSCVLHPFLCLQTKCSMYCKNNTWYIHGYFSACIFTYGLLFFTKKKVHSNFALRHMIVFSKFEIKEMFWWNNFFFFLLFFVIKCITLLGKSTVLLPFDPQNCLFYFYTLNFLNW